MPNTKETNGTIDGTENLQLLDSQFRGALRKIKIKMSTGYFYKENKAFTDAYFVLEAEENGKIPQNFGYGKIDIYEFDMLVGKRGERLFRIESDSYKARKAELENIIEYLKDYRKTS